MRYTKEHIVNATNKNNFWLIYNDSSFLEDWTIYI